VQIITEILTVLSQQLSTANLQHFAIIVDSILGISNSVTTLSVARYSSLSYRTIQRFYALKDVNWLLVNLMLFKYFVYKENKKYLLAADETVKSKAGRQTYGIGLFYSSLQKQVIKAVSFLVISIIDIEEKKSYVLACRQLIGSNLVKKTADKKSAEKTSSKGRPKGSKNKPKAQSSSYQLLKSLLILLKSELKVFLPDLNCLHITLDGFYGHEAYLLLALEQGLNIISKFKSNAHLILPFQGSQSGLGRPKTLGDKVDLDTINEKFYIKTIKDQSSNVSSRVYQFEGFTPKIAGKKLNIVVLIHTHLLTKRVSRTILFSNDLTLDAETIIDYYSLRFQIEFDFRDAKQFYGLADFKNYKETQLTNAVNISFTMTVIGKLVLEKYKRKLNCSTMGIIDLKATFRIEKYAKILLNTTENDLDLFFNSPLFLKIARLDAIHI
jgi:putative transposase